MKKIGMILILTVILSFVLPSLAQKPNITQQEEAEFRKAALEFIERGEAALKTNDATTAFTYFENANKLAPDLIRPWVGMGLALYGRFNKDKCASFSVSEAIRLDPKSLDLYLLKARIDIAWNPAEAEQTLLKAIELHPASAPAQYQMGMVRVKLKKPEEGIKNLRKATELKPEYADAYFKLAETYDSLYREQEAFEAYQRTVDLDSQNTEALQKLCYKLIFRRKFVDAKKAYEQLQVLHKEKVASWEFSQLSTTFKSMERLDKAEKAVTISPKNAAALNELGASYFNFQGGSYEFVPYRNDEKAVQLFKKAVQIKPSYAEARLNLGLGYLKLGNFAAAQQQLTILNRQNKTLAAQLQKEMKEYLRPPVGAPGGYGVGSGIGSPPPPPPLANPSSVEKALYTRESPVGKCVETEDAIWEANNNLYFNRNDANAYFKRGQAYEKQGKLAQAIEDYSKSISINPRSATERFFRGFTAFSLERYDIVVEDMNAYLEISSWLNQYSPSIVLLGTFSYRELRRQEEAKKLLDKAAASYDASTWEYAAIRYLRYLRRDISAEDMFSAIKDQDDMILARAIVAYDLALSNAANLSDAKRYAESVIKDNKPNQFAYKIAQRALNRIQAMQK